MAQDPIQSPIQSTSAFPVLPSAAFRVVHGVNDGDALSYAEDIEPGDTYWVDEGARYLPMTVDIYGDRDARVSADSRAGSPGAHVYLDSCLTFMTPDGSTTEALVLVEVAPEAAEEPGRVNDVYLLPLVAMQPRTDYQLVGIDTESAYRKLAEVTCVSFSRGTMITLASGAQRAIEDLQIGDLVLTRDDGAQPIRWIGATTIRAYGEMSPIVITAGALSNTNDLVVSPDHRLFVYQRQDALGIGRREVLVRARHLVNGTTVYWQEGGFVDYFQLLFDSHQIIYAEGIAAETLLVDAQTRAALPAEISSRYDPRKPRLSAAMRKEFEVTRRVLERPDAIDLLRQASRSAVRPGGTGQD